MRRGQRLMLGLAVGALVSGGACYFVLHPAWKYHGDGTIDDSGVISYPRYRAAFAPIQFNIPSQHRYSFRGFPGSPAWVMLETPSAPLADSLEALQTHIEVAVVDDRGRVLCRGAGSPAGRDAERWVVTSSQRAIGLWHMGCNGFGTGACKPCQLTVTISDVDPATPSIPLVPTLKGGGIELP